MRQVEVLREEPLQHVDILIQRVVYIAVLENAGSSCNAGLCWHCPFHYMEYWGVQKWDKY